jgi:hypothetical protein
MVSQLLSFCPTAWEPGRGIGKPHPAEGKTAAQEAPEADSSDDGWVDRQTMDGKGTSSLPFTVNMIIQKGKIGNSRQPAWRAGWTFTGFRWIQTEKRPSWDVFQLYTTDKGRTLIHVNTILNLLSRG